MRRKHYLAMSEFESRIIETEKGPVRTRPHYATFNEKHNASRVKVYLTLYQWALTDGNRGLTLGEVSNLSGVDSVYISHKMAKWVEWGFCKKTEPILVRGRLFFAYTLADRGYWFLEKIVPKEWLDYYAAEIKEHREQSKGSNLINDAKVYNLGSA